jgi:hypothetical protein
MTVALRRRMPVAVEALSFHSILEVTPQGRLLSDSGVAAIITSLPSTKNAAASATVPKSATIDTLECTRTFARREIWNRKLHSKPPRDSCCDPRAQK